MDDIITRTFRDHYAKTFERHGATSKGVDWNDETDVIVRYDKMLAVLQKDFAVIPPNASVLDVGCGWGGLLQRARSLDLPIRYTGIDVVDSMVEHGNRTFPDARFICGDVFDLNDDAYDFVVCNGILTLKLGFSIPDMERFTKRFAAKMFGLCRHGMAFNMMSTRVNYMVDNLYYQNPGELLTWLLAEVSPRVRLDHGYSSLMSGRRKLYEFTVYVYKD
jgi:2-polyprenyl-3-methyl-5-hydroxy-6-metoxy-1,4-benzoquinol methylase